MSIRAKAPGDGQDVVEELLLQPDSISFDLIVEAEGDHLSDEELEHLDAQLLAGWRCIQAGKFRPAREVLAELRSKYG